jgi:p-aminobenzoyl-glutamate transporter AbgT
MNASEIVVTTSSCVPTYIVVWALLIGIFSVSDYFLWKKIVEPYLKEYKDAYDATSKQEDPNKTTGDLTKGVSGPVDKVPQSESKVKEDSKGPTVAEESK